MMSVLVCPTDEVYECRGGQGEGQGPGGCSYEAVEAKPVIHARHDGPVPVLPICAT